MAKRGRAAAREFRKATEMITFTRTWSVVVTHRGEPNHYTPDDIVTACGISTNLGYYTFESCDDPDHINCLRCRRTKAFKEMQRRIENERQLGRVK